MNNPVKIDVQRKPNFVPPIKKLVPAEPSPRQATVATADSTVVNQKVTYEPKKYEPSKPRSQSVSETNVKPVKTIDTRMRQKEVTDKVGPVGLKGMPEVPIEGLTSMRVDFDKNKAEQAFKSHVDKIKDRN